MIPPMGRILKKSPPSCSVATFTENSYLVLVTLFSQLFLTVR